MTLLCKTSTGSTAVLRMYNVFGARFEGITPDMLNTALDQLGPVKAMDIYIDSEGGVVDEGIAIHNILKRHPARKRVIVDGLAASIATYVALAGDEIVATSNSQWMIHKAWGVFAGDDDGLTAAAQALRNATEIIRDAYTAKTGMPAADVAAMMAAETWMKADKALQLGFIDAIENVDRAKTAVAKPPRAYAMLNFKNVPQELQQSRRGVRTMLASMHMRTMQMNRRATGKPA